MKIPAKVRYAVRTLVEIGKDPGKILSLAEVEKEQMISAKFAKQFLQPLEKENIVGSKRGVKGGYFLKRKPSEIRIKDVFKALGEKINLAPCLDDLDVCQRIGICGAKDKWSELQKMIEEFLAAITIEDIIKKDGRI